MTMNENVDVHLSCNGRKRVQLANWNVQMSVNRPYTERRM